MGHPPWAAADVSIIAASRRRTELFEPEISSRLPHVLASASKPVAQGQSEPMARALRRRRDDPAHVSLEPLPRPRSRGFPITQLPGGLAQQLL